MAQLIGRGGMVAGDTDSVDSTARNVVGTRAYDVNGNEYVYLVGAASVVIGSWVNIDVAQDGVVVLLDTDTASSQQGRVAIAMAAIVAAKYGWFCVRTGPASSVNGLALTGSTDAKNAFATSTGGSVDDSGAGAEVLIYGAWSVGAVSESTFLQAFALNDPFMVGLSLD